MTSIIDLRWKMIRVEEELHKELAKVGQYGDSMSDIIKKLLDFYNKSRK